MAAILVFESAVEPSTPPEMSSSQPSRVSSIDVAQDKDALEAIVLDLERGEGQALFGFVRRLGLSDAQAADAVQDVLLRLWAELIQAVRSSNRRRGRSERSTAWRWISIVSSAGSAPSPNASC